MGAKYESYNKAASIIFGGKLPSGGDIIVKDSGMQVSEFKADFFVITASLSRHAADRCSYIMEKISAEGPGRENTALVLFGCSEDAFDKKTIFENYGNPGEIFVFPYSDLVAKYASSGKLYQLAEKKGFSIKPVEQLTGFIGSRPEMIRRVEIKIQDAGYEDSSEKNIYAGKVALKFYETIDVRKISGDMLADNSKKEKIMNEMLAKIREIAFEVCGNRGEKYEETVKAVYQEVAGLGAIEDLLKNPAISEIMVNGKDKIYVETSGKIMLTKAAYTDDDSVIRAIQRIVMPLGRRIDESSPFVDARLPDGSRVNAVIPPLSVDGPVITIRKFSNKKLTVDDLIRFGSINEKTAAYLNSAVKERKNILVSGGTGSGKTTLLNVLSGFIPEDERIVTIEDSAELKLSQEHVVRLESRPANMEGRGEITIRDLLRNSLRMRPDRIIVGECRGGEALDMLQAMNTGHEGSMTTVHANSPRDALSRIEVMALMSGVELPHRAIREQVKSAIDIIIQQSRLKDGTRKVTAISEVTGIDGDIILMQDVFNFQNN